jgi:enoyl-CoA hydratase/carnithine racemase
LPRETVIEERAGHVATLTMNRPDRRNAFNAVMWRELREAMSDAREDDEIRVVVVTGAGSAFTAGQDLGEMSAVTAGDGSGGPHPFGAFMDMLCEFDKPLVAAVNGVGVGMGLTMLLHCDFVYIAQGARLRAPFVQLGVVPEAASSYLMPLVIGHRNAAEVLYTADWIDAERAVALGLAGEVCSPEALLPTAQAKAAQVAANAPGSLRHTKRLLLETRKAEVAAARRREDAAFVVRTGSPENAEAIKAFFEKRPPDFTGLPQI